MLEWKATIDSEEEALVSQGTWPLVSCPNDANIVTFECMTQGSLGPLRFN